MNTERISGIRFGPGGKIPPVVKSLLIINVAFFLLFALLDIVSPELKAVLYGNLAYTPELFLTRLKFWQPFTYMFLHAGFGHLFWNMLTLWMFGSEVERHYGSRAFGIMYAICGVAAGLAGSFMWHASIVGASGAIFAVMMIYGILYPDRQILLFFIIPVRCMVFIIILAGMETLYLISTTNDGVAHAVHLGGLLIGYLMYRYMPSVTSKIESMQYSSELEREQRRKLEAMVEQDMVNEILDKINSRGIHSLTKDEVKLLKNRAKKRREEMDKYRS